MTDHETPRLPVAAVNNGRVSSLNCGGLSASADTRRFFEGPDDAWIKECLPHHPEQWRRIIEGETL